MADQETLQLLLTKMAIDVADLKKGLQEGRNDLQGFKTMAQGVGESVKKALAFTGIAIGLYEIASALKSFAKEAALVGARTETLDIAMKQVGKTYGVSATSLKFYVDELKAAGITTQEAMVGVTKFLTTGLPLDQITALATRARDIAVVAGINTSEAFNRMIQGIITGEQETLRRLMIQVGSTDDIFKRYAAALGITKEELNSVQKSQAMLNEVMRLSAGFAGIAAEADNSVGKQLQSMARFAEEARNSLWALFGPIMLEGVQQMTRGWKELKTWADENEASLRSWGESIADFLQQIIKLGVAIGKYLIEHKDLVVALIEFKLFSVAAGWVLALGTAAATAAGGLRALATGATAVNLAMLPWLVTLKGIVVALAAYGAYQGIKKPTDLGAMSPEEAQLMGEAWFHKGPTAPVPEDRIFPIGEDTSQPNLSPAEVKRRAKKEGTGAQDQASRDAAKPTGKEKKGKDDNLLAPTLAMYKALREVELQAAQDSFDLLKTSNEAKRAELERGLAAQEMDGQTYYQRLQDLQRTETAASLAMIEQKRQAQQKAHQESLTELDADEKLSPEAKTIARRKLEAEQRKSLAKLDTDAAQVRLEDEKKITDELRRQVEVRKEYRQKTEDLNLETAQLTGAISEQEANLQRLTLEWQRTKQEAIAKSAYTPEFAAALDANLRAKTVESSPWGQKLQSASQIFMSGFSDLANTIVEGSAKISEVLDQFGKKIMQDTFKLFFEDLSKAISQGIKNLVNSIANEMQSSGAGGGFGGLFSGIGGFFKNLFGGGGGELPVSLGIADMQFAHGAILKSFADGGILSRPTFFPMGVAGEAGTEVIAPLSDLPNLLPKSGPTQVNIINNTGTEAQGTAQQNDDGSLDIFLEKKIAGYVSRGGELSNALTGKFNIRERF